VWLGFSAVASGQSSRASRPPEDEDLAARVNTKLEEVLETQQQILKRLDEVMEELKVVKIRATLR
jgi:phage tail tape-measure protein